MINCIIAERDAASVKKIEACIKSSTGISVKATFTHAKHFLEYLAKNTPDIIIVNINLPDLGGYDFIRRLNYQPKIIAVSSDAGAAIEGYGFDISGFVKKPVAQAQLLKTVLKIENDFSLKRNAVIWQPPLHRFLFIRADYKLIKINFEDILYIEGLKDYSKIYTTPAAGKAIITLQNLKSFEEKLSPDDFIRIHRSYIVSLSKIDMIQKNSIHIGKNEIPISDGFRSNLYGILSKYS